MNISKKALMSVLMALTSLAAMAQPYYHVMKQDGSKLTEKATYDGQTYKVKIDMVEPEVKTEARPECAIGNKITVTSGKYPYKTRSFYFTNKGNVYYNGSENKYYFENSQLDYPNTYSLDHQGHLGWGSEGNGKEFFLTGSGNLKRLQEDLGNERWTVLNAWEWEYVCKNLGESGWTVDGKRYFLIDTTPGKSLLRAIETKNGGKTMSKEDFEYYEAQGLVCLPPTGYRHYYESLRGYPRPYTVGTYYSFWQLELQGTCGFYWSCTPESTDLSYYVLFYLGHFAINTYYRKQGFAVRLVVLAD